MATQDEKSPTDPTPIYRGAPIEASDQTEQDIRDQAQVKAEHEQAGHAPPPLPDPKPPAPPVAQTSEEKELLKRGGEVVGGTMYLERQEVGSYQGDGFKLHPTGEAMLNKNGTEGQDIANRVQASRDRQVDAEITSSRIAHLNIGSSQTPHALPEGQADTRNPPAAAIPSTHEPQRPPLDDGSKTPVQPTIRGTQPTVPAYLQENPNAKFAPPPTAGAPGVPIVPGGDGSKQPDKQDKQPAKPKPANDDLDLDNL